MVWLLLLLMLPLAVLSLLMVRWRDEWHCRWNLDEVRIPTDRKLQGSGTQHCESTLKLNCDCRSEEDEKRKVEGAKGEGERGKGN